MSALAKFIGTGVALVTPFNEDGSIDYAGLERLLVHTSDGGVDYWVVMGTTGESVTLTKEEKVAVLDFVKKHNPAKLPIVYGIGGNNTEEILKTIKETDLHGVDAILSVSPSYNKPTQAGILAHFHTIAEQSPLPIILYNVPSRTSSNMTAATTLQLAVHPNIIAIKEACPDINQIIDIARQKPENFLLLSGDDMMGIPSIAVGAQGVISVLANAFPGIFSQMVTAALENDFLSASQFLYELSPINPLMYEESNPVGVKEALAIQNVCSNYVRLPLLKASEELRAKIKNVMPV